MKFTTITPSRFALCTLLVGLSVLLLGLISHTATRQAETFGLTFEAEAGTIESPFTVVSGGVQQDTTTSTPATGGKASYTFHVSAAGNYTLSMMVDAPNADHNSLFVNVGVEPVETNQWEIPFTKGVEARTVSWVADAGKPHVFTLGVGAQQLIVRGQESGTLIDKIGFIPVALAPLPPGGVGSFPTPPTGVRID
jgi:hypothetical protein